MARHAAAARQPLSRSREQPPRLAIGLVSALALAYEVLLIRLFSIIQWHHFAYMIISLALLGYAASGTFVALTQARLLRHFPAAYVANVLLFGLAAVLCFLGAQHLAFNPEELLWDPGQPRRLLAIYLLLSLPFFFASNSLTLALARFRAEIPRLYALDLCGAGLGSLGIVLTLFVLMPMTALRMIGAAAILASALAWWEMGSTHRAWGALLGLGAVLPMLLPDAWAGLVMSPYKELSQALRVQGRQVVAERSSPLGYLTVVDSPAVPWRHAPGLSLVASGEPPPQLGIFTDGEGFTVITRDSGNQQALGYLDQVPSALPYHLAVRHQVLVLGAGGGSEVLQARAHGATRIAAVEMNPQVVELVRTSYGAFAGLLYDAPEVRVHVAEARGFLADSSARYDLIQLALLDSFAASAAGLYALQESYLYTVEAFGEFLAHLEPGGMLAVSRWLTLPPKDTLKLFATAVQALEAAGVSDPENRLALVRGWQTATMLVKNGRFTAPEISALRAFCADRLFDTAYYPGMAAEEGNRYNILAAPFFFQGATALLGPGRGAFLAAYKFDIRPATDDRPFFFQFMKWPTLLEVLALRGQGGMPLVDWGVLVLLATLAQALLAGTALILLPLGLSRRTALAAASLGRVRIFIYFFCVGVAFLFLEIAFIQRFILFLHHPLYATAVVLTAFLLFAGLGSAWAQRLATRYGARRVVRCAVAGITVLSLLYLAGTTPAFALFARLPDWGRVGGAIALIAPLACGMGMPFPLALQALGTGPPAAIPWAWGINGCASVLSPVLASLIAIHCGFQVVVTAAVLLYWLVACCFPGNPDPETTMLPVNT